MRHATLALVVLCACEKADRGLASESTIVDLGTLNLDREGDGVVTGETDMDIPEGTTGADLVVQLTDGSGAVVMISGLSRGTTVIRDYLHNPLLPQRGEPTEEVASLMVPTAREVPFGTGLHHLVVAANEAHQGVRLTGIFKSGGSTDSGSLDVTVHLAGLSGIRAATAADSPKVKTFLSEYGRLLGKAGIALGRVAFVDVTDESLFDMVGPSSAPGTPLARLFATGAKTPGRHLQLFITRSLSQEGSSVLLGIAGALPGPGELGGTIHSGVVASGEDLLQDVPDGVDDRTVGARLVAQIAAHETLHYLGLNHTTEGHFDCGAEPDHDPILDTPECGVAQDANHDCSLSSTECASSDATNLMFPAGVQYDRLPPGTDAVVTPGQSYVALRNPLVQ